MFDAQKEASELRRQTQIIRKRNYKKRTSRLDQYKDELLALKREGSSTAELQRWLRKRRIKVVHSTVLR